MGPSASCPANFLTQQQNPTSNSDDPLSPDSLINTWELMEGLDENEHFNFHMVDSPKKLSQRETEASEIVVSYEIVENPESKPLWKHLSEESLLAKMDLNVVSSYQQALFSRQHGCEKPNDNWKPQEVESLEMNGASLLVSDGDEPCCLLGGEDRIVLYYTSFRPITNTYKDCSTVRMFLRGFRVCVDERDLYMDLSFRIELQDALKGKALSLPQVFFKGKYIGGAEEIKRLNDEGELAKLMKGIPLTDMRSVCERFGDATFVLCTNCNGSRKVYNELKICLDCNENGLIRCSGRCP